MPDYKKQACPRSIQKETQLQAKKKTIFDAAAKIGKLEFLNDFGLAGGNVRKGLEQLAVVSNTVRVGDKTTDTTILNDDGGGLMDAMGLDGALQTAVAQFDPNAVNGAVGASKALVARAKQGNFRMEDIATGVGEFKNIALIANKIFKPGAEDTPSENYQKFKCRPSPYAMDLVHRAPKQNFQFVVEIELSAPYREHFVSTQSVISQQFETRKQVYELENQKVEAALTNETNSELSTNIAFLVKNSARPSVTYEYEDLNYYNYRTKGIRKATFNPVTMNFIDDQLNSMAQFYAFYTSAMSPIVNMGKDPKLATGIRQNYGQAGMDFADYGAKQASTKGEANTFPAYAASVGALRPASASSSNNTHQIIDRITIYQFGKNANTLTAFHMFSPRITNLNPSEVTHADSGEGQMLSMDLDYDYFTIQPEIPIGDANPNSQMSSQELAELTGGAAGAFFPVKHFPADSGGGSDGGDTGFSSYVTKAGSLLGLTDADR